MGVEFEEGCIYTLRIDVYQIIIAYDIGGMQYKVKKLIEVYTHKWGLTVNLYKTKYLCITCEPNNLILADDQKICHCQDFFYLGVTFGNPGTDTKEVWKRIVQAKKL